MNDLLPIIIESFSEIITKNDIDKIFKVLITSFYGLPLQEIQASAEVSSSVLTRFIKLFRVLLMKSRDIYSLHPRKGIIVKCNESVERVIFALTKTENSIRRLDELTYQYY